MGDEVAENAGEEEEEGDESKEDAVRENEEKLRA